MKIEKGFKQFLIKTGVFVGLFLAIQILTIGISTSTKIPFYLTPFYLVDLAKVGFFVLILFFISYRERLSKLKENPFEIKSIIIFGILEILALISYFRFKVFILDNINLVNENLFLFQFLTYFMLFLMLAFLGLAVFGYEFIKKFIRTFKKEIFLFLSLSIVLYSSSYYVQKSWHYFSFVVANAVTWILSLTGKAILFFNDKLPAIQFNGFAIAIDSPCSGIESMFLFTILYLFIASLDWKVLNKKKLAIMFIPGLISVFLLNILRIYFLMLLGAYLSSSFALGMFHTNASWIFFLAYFGLFWRVLYKWMKK
ncbi:exosortase/archaeosortase family protein [Patescibacteria group bacterium]|nr:exosortase/archaeosortase family protein [Patescibacteria group bacterium]